MKHENSFDPLDEVPTLPEEMKGTRAALFHILREQKASRPKPVHVTPRRVVKDALDEPAQSQGKPQWDTVLAADNFQFLD